MMHTFFKCSRDVKVILIDFLNGKMLQKDNMKREPNNFIAVLEDKKVELSRGIKYKRNSGRKGNIRII